MHRNASPISRFLGRGAGARAASPPRKRGPDAGSGAGAAGPGGEPKKRPRAAADIRAFFAPPRAPP